MMDNNGRLFLFGEYILPNTVGTEIGVWWGEFSDFIIEHVKLQITTQSKDSASCGVILMKPG